MHDDPIPISEAEESPAPDLESAPTEGQTSERIDTATVESATQPHGKKPRSATSRRIRRTILLLLMLLVINHLVIPQLAGARKALTTLSHVTWWLLIVALALQMAALFSYVMLTRATLATAPDKRPIKLFELTRIQLSTKSVTNLVPGGSAAGGALGYRLLVEAGAQGTDAAFAMATVGIGSAVILNLILWLALIVSIPRVGYQPGYAIAAIVGAVALTSAAALVILLVRGHGPLDRMVRSIARRIPRMTADQASAVLARIVAQLRQMAHRPELIRGGIGWAVANWLFDAASLWVFLAAFGAQVPVDSLLVAFGLANVLAVIPFTPGGLGVVEAVLTSTLIALGVPSGPAAVGVITYRIAQYWLPIPLGAVSYLSLKIGPGRLAATRRERLGALATEAFEPRTPDP